MDSFISEVHKNHDPELNVMFSSEFIMQNDKQWNC